METRIALLAQAMDGLDIISNCQLPSDIITVLLISSEDCKYAITVIMVTCLDNDLVSVLMIQVSSVKLYTLSLCKADIWHWYVSMASVLERVNFISSFFSIEKLCSSVVYFRLKPVVPRLDNAINLQPAVLDILYLNLRFSIIFASCIVCDKYARFNNFIKPKLCKTINST